MGGFALTLHVACFCTGLAVAVAPEVAAADFEHSARWLALDRSTKPTDIALTRSINGLKDWQACVEWGQLYRSNKNQRREDALRDYLGYRGFVNDLDEAHIGDRSVALGMTSCGVLAALGRPREVNTTELASSYRSQWVYGDRVYVYTNRKNGADIVDAIQR